MTQYSPFVRTPGSLIPKSAQGTVMGNPGRDRNYDVAENCLLRESAMVRDLVAYFLKSPSLTKSEEYWDFFKGQWKKNIVNYIKSTNGALSVSDVEVEQYKGHYKYRTALRLIGEYVQRSREMQKIKDRYPHVPPEKNKLLWGHQKSLNDIHGRLMPFHQQMKQAVNDPVSSVKK